MMPTRHEHHVSVPDSHRFVERAVLGIDPLYGKALRGIKAMVVGLFEIRHAGKVVFVVPVTWVG